MRLDEWWVYERATGSYARADALTPDELVAAWADGLQLLRQEDFAALVADAIQRERSHDLAEAARWN